jgi:hypothetical protein
MLQIQRDFQKTQAKASRDSRRDEQQKARDALFNGTKRKITESTTKNKPKPVTNNPQADTKFHKKDQRRPNVGDIGDGGGGNVDTYDDTELRNRIAQLENRLNSASISAECSESGSVIVNLTI